MTELGAWLILGAACVWWLILSANSYDQKPLCSECFGTGANGNKDCPVCRGKGRME